MLRRRMLMKRLPSEYQEVEWIQSDGNQYIDTGYVPNDSSGIRCKFHIANLVDNVVVGCASSNSARWYIGSNGTNMTIYSAWNSNDNPSTRPSCTVDKDYITKMNYLNDRKRITNDIEYTSITEALASQRYSTYLFGCNWVGTFAYSSTRRIYYCQLSEGLVLVRNFVPCYRISDSEIGMYDLVNKVFYTNQGTGTFTKGADVN